MATDQVRKSVTTSIHRCKERKHLKQSQTNSSGKCGTADQDLSKDRQASCPAEG